MLKQTAAHSSVKLNPSATTSFADVAHQTLVFDGNEETSRLVLALLDTPWVQRLRRVRQTGNTYLVYMFAEHSRFGHSLGVAYLATRLMNSLAQHAPDVVTPYQNAVAAAALLHDIGHVAPGSHLAERVWAPDGKVAHEEISTRVIAEDSPIRSILESFDPALPDQVIRILRDDDSLPRWTRQIISGGGWNADRGNWTIVDSAMASVSYGRYNVFALLDAFRLSAGGDLVLQESRLDALTHFFVARDSMYRQVYQHRVLQAVDALSEMVIVRIRDLISSTDDKRAALATSQIYCDDAMFAALSAANYGTDLKLSDIFQMTESWWFYHLEQWCNCNDKILADLCLRLRDRRLLKTIRLDSRVINSAGKTISSEDESILTRAREAAERLGYDPRYYVLEIRKADKHRGKTEEVPQILLDNGEVVPVTAVEPLIGELIARPEMKRNWVAVPKEIKEILGKLR